MGFWGRLFGRTEFDSTVTDFQKSVPVRGSVPGRESLPAGDSVSAREQPGATGSFRLEIEDVFFITGRGTVVTGTVGSGKISVGDEVGIRQADGSRRRARVTGVEAFRKRLTSAGAGEHIGVLLDSVAQHELAAGDILEA